ncbi:MAG: DUF177 domain-containing protein [Candidatus Krumholzibacteriota bacterium]|nr:DUF177 domain-containing protein [Candidatus Krumholzibacteriota bacterium]
MELDLGHVEDRESFSFSEGFELPSFDGGENDCRAVVEARVTKTGIRYLLEAKVDCVLSTECSRCGIPFDHFVSTEFEIVFQRGERSVLPGIEDEDDFVFLSLGDTFSYDIFPRVREAILLELPIKYLCREECAGICASCGTDLNTGRCECSKEEVDPRWAALDRIKVEIDDNQDPLKREE